MKIYKFIFLFLFVSPVLIFTQPSHIEKFYGYNKMETKHFKIIFEKTDIEAAKEVYTICEEVYDQVTKLLDSYPKKVKILIHGRLDMANGSYYPIPEHLNLYVTSPSNFFNGAQTESWLRGLLVHELTHYIHISYEKGWLYELSKVFGPPVKTVPGGFLPGWILEGYTTNTETMYTQGGRGRNALFEMIYKSHILEGNLFTLKQAAFGSAEPPQGRIYVSGYIFIRYLLETYGENLLKELHTEMIKTLSADKALIKVTGKSTQQHWDNMRQKLMGKYRSYEDIHEGILLSPYEKGNWSLPQITDNGMIVYRQDMKNPSGLIRYNPKTKKSKWLIKTHLKDSWSFTSNHAGNKIIFATYDIDLADRRGATYTSDLFLIDEKNKTPKRLTKNKHLWHPCLSKDGNKLIAVQRRGSYSDLVEVNQENNKITLLFRLKQATIYTPTISSDRKKIAFIANIRGKQDLWILDKNGARPLTAFNGGAEYYPTFIDDNNILYTSDKSKAMVLYSININTKEEKQRLMDPIGIRAARMVNNNFIYSTYRSRGKSFYISTDQQILETKKNLEKEKSSKKRIKNIQQKISNPVSFSNYPEPTLLEQGEITTHLITPQFLGWAPLPLNYVDSSKIGISAGLGAIFFGQTIDLSTYIQALVTFPLSFKVFQPTIYIKSSFPLGRVKMSYTLKQQYGNYDKSKISTIQEYRYRQEISQQLNAAIPLYSHQIAGDQFALYLKTGILHQCSFENSKSFHFFDIDKNKIDQFEVKNSLVQFNGIAFTYNKTRSRTAIYPELQVYTTGGMQIGIPLKQTEVLELSGSMDIGISIPIVSGHQFFSQFTTGYSNLQRPKFSFAPRGFDSFATSKPGKGIATFGYNFNFENLDLPLFSGFSFHGLAAAIFLQTQFWYNANQNQSIVDPNIYAGIEFKPIIGYSSATFPITIGINFRFDSTFNRNFNPSSDIGTYFSINTDFITGMNFEKPSWQPLKEK